MKFLAFGWYLFLVIVLASDHRGDSLQEFFLIKFITIMLVIASLSITYLRKREV